MSRNTGKKLYIGIDLNEEFAMVSFLGDGIETPSTISTNPSREEFSIPLCMCYVRDTEKWSYGEEAQRFSRAGMGEFYDSLLSRAVKGEMTLVGNSSASYVSLLSIFLKRLVEMCANIIVDAVPAVVVLSIDTLSIRVIETLNEALEQISLPDVQTHIMDHKECFYYYALSQDDELVRNNMALFDYQKDNLRALTLKRELKSIPQKVSIEEHEFGSIAYSPDELLTGYIPQVFGKEIYSSVYLVGDGFDGGWMKESLKLLCRGRRAFQGKNLYSKGAGYAARVLSGREKWEYIYIGRHTMKFNVSLKISDVRDMKFLTLVSAGERWFETKGSCEVIIDGDASIDFWIHMPEKRDAKIETFTLRGLGERENRTTRIAIQAKPKSDHEVGIEIVDVGFGELSPSSNRKWEALISV